ncbi:hypothetical protein DAPPUDRAFT_323846 [Daphnia pulex]|uniref:Uncharacterized protein n=1 Tax=Daphnia pulex TaxID=6669 RepID=E9GZX8_DAPPU|nr:hypothetical protein DAPPUDRAFT_323846 [Daphnia pulex]|eukprot:EFX74895.1 hypothetical protein DAPPUDRAFT_323846 [Daphnia pulex]
MATSESITGMPDLGGQVPGIPNDTGLGGSHHSSRESVRVPLTPEERLIAIERTRIERDTLAAVLEEQCDELANYVINRGSRSIVNHLNVGLGRRMDQFRQAHLDHNKALHDNNDPFDNPYAYIIGFEIRARDCCTQRHHPLLHGAPRVFPATPPTSSSTTPASKPPAKNKPVAMATIDKEPDDNTSLAIVPVMGPATCYLPRGY